MSSTDPRPDTPDSVRTAVGGVVRTPLDIGEAHDCGPLPTRADTVRTRPDDLCPDTPDGVRVEYRARVPRHLVPAAFAEALDLIARETRIPLDGQADDD
jgi:hypothetical protein